VVIDMIEWILSFEFNSVLGICLYWAPLLLCSYGYAIRTWVNYRKDRIARDSTENKHYSPTDTLGSLIGRGLVAIIPIANLLAAIFDVAPETFGRFLGFVGKVFSQPLVPKR
jgi:hypothetical protein